MHSALPDLATPKRLPVRVPRTESQAGSLRISQDPARPTVVSMKNFAFLALGSPPAPLLPRFQAQGEKNRHTQTIQKSGVSSKKKVILQQPYYTVKHSGGLPFRWST
jgi:hypothetical protein